MAVARAVQLLNDVVGQLKAIVVRVRQEGVQRAAVGADDRCNVIERLGAALDLQRVNARLQIKSINGAVHRSLAFRM